MILTHTLIAGLAAIGLMLSAGPLGCFVVWRRMAYFGDAVAHAAILGIALSLTTSWPILVGILLSSGAAALILAALEDKHGLTSNTLLGVLAHAGLAFGLVIISLIHGNSDSAHIDLEHYLFGDILTLNTSDLLQIWSGSAIILPILLWHWSSLLTTCLSPDLAHAAGLSPRRYRIGLTLVLALLVAMAVQIVGVLLVTAMLIIPAAAVRPFCKTPESMALAATLTGILACLCGISLSIGLNTPAGPTIVATASTVFAGAYVLAKCL